VVRAAQAPPSARPPPASLLPDPPSASTDAAADADALRLCGNSAFAAGDWDGAAASYAASLARHPTAPAAANLSAAALRAGDPATALASADTALALRPHWAKAHARRGAALAALGDDVGAFLAWDVAVRCDPGGRGWAAGRRAALAAAAAVRGWRLPGVGKEGEEDAGMPLAVVEGEGASE
jgi:tetratricopeptide (TPR) repeat protein